MLKVGDKAVVRNDNGKFFKGCEVTILLDMTEKGKAYGDDEPFYVQTDGGKCCAWYSESDLQKVEG